MRGYRRSGQILLSLIISLLIGFPGAALEVGDTAPRFTAPLLEGGGVLAADSLFFVRGWTLLVVWDTDCPKCMGDFVGLSRVVGNRDPRLLMVGVSQDGERVGDARRLVKGVRPDFPCLWDADGAIADAYDTDAVSFSAFLLDSAAVVRVVQYDHPESLDELLDAMDEAMEAGTAGGGEGARP